MITNKTLWMILIITVICNLGVITNSTKINIKQNTKTIISQLQTNLNQLPKPSTPTLKPLTPIIKTQTKSTNIQPVASKVVNQALLQNQSGNINTLPLFSNSSFQGFTDRYKDQMAYLISTIKNLNTSEGKLLTDKLTMSLISISNTLKLINMNKQNQNKFKTLLQYQVKTFMTDLDRVQDHLKKINGTVINGNSNYVAGKNLIQGSNNIAIGNSNAVIGNNNALSGNYSIISGYNNGMIGNNGVTIGVNNQVKGNNSYVFNSNGVVNKDNMMVVGNYSIDLNQLQKGKGQYLIKK